jgi:hypothetical protein
VPEDISVQNIEETMQAQNPELNLKTGDTNIHTEYFKHAAHSPFFPLQNAVYFIMLPFLVPVLFIFYIQVC